MNDITRGFKRKTIVGIITKKVDDWVATISDESLRVRIKEHYIITGGAIASMLLGEMPNDFDVYFDDVETAAAVAQYYLPLLKQNTNAITVTHSVNGRGRVEVKLATPFKQKYDPEPRIGVYSVNYISENAISLSDSIQLIMRFIGNPEQIHENFDFSHTRNYYSVKTGLVLNQNSLECILAKELKYTGSLYPICSLFRIKKFIKRGWNITAGEILKIAFDISKLDLTDMSVLREQLVGVDAAYFNQIINLLKLNQDRIIDRFYLFSLIDYIFDSDILKEDMGDCDE